MYYSNLANVLPMLMYCYFILTEYHYAYWYMHRASVSRLKKCLSMFNGPCTQAQIENMTLLSAISFKSIKTDSYSFLFTYPLTSFRYF